MASIGREVHPFRNSSRCDMRPSDASNPTGITLGLQPAAGGTAEQRTTISNGVNAEGWRIPNLRGLICYSADVEKMDGVKRIVDKFYMLVEDMSQR